MKAELERLRDENERLKNRQTRGVSLKGCGPAKVKSVSAAWSPRARARPTT